MMGGNLVAAMVEAMVGWKVTQLVVRMVDWSVGLMDV